MNTSRARHAVVVMSSIATVSWTAFASAQSVVVQSPPPAQPTTTVVAPVPQPQSTPVVVNNQAPSASPIVAEAPPGADEGTHWRPNRYLLMSGLVLAGAPYIASVSVAATSSNGADGNLYIPAFGPWLDIGQRGGCPASGSCGAEVGNKVLLVGDGILQSVGVLQILGAFLFPETEHVTTVQTGKNGEGFIFSPSGMGVGGYGLAAVGQF
jgi:hypothetical protein